MREAPRQAQSDGMPVDDEAGRATPDPSPAVPLSEKNLTRRLFRNTAFLVIGRNVNALSRLVAAGMIIRGFGSDTFGQYALIMVLLTIAEWILDFGTTEVFVREANQAPGRRLHLRNVLVAMKLAQAPLSVLVMLAGLLLMRYPRHVVLAGLLGGISLLFLAGVTAYRAMFKANLTMEREVGSEFFSVLTMLPLIQLAAGQGWGLMGLMGAVVISRAVFFLGCLLQGRGEDPLSIAGVGREDIKRGAGSALAIGTIGFVVVLYNAVDVLVLSRFASLSDVALYSAAQRFTMPLMMALSAVAVTFYPVLAFLKSPEQFREACQHAVDTTLVMGGIVLAGILCGAEFLMNLLGPEFVSSANVLRVLAVMTVIKSMAMVMGPALFIVKAQRYALIYIVSALILKLTVVTIVASRAGALGVAIAVLAVELCFLVPVSLYCVYRYTGLAVKWPVTLRAPALVMASVLITRMVLPLGTLASAVAATIAYAVLAFAFGVITVSQARLLLSRKSD